MAANSLFFCPFYQISLQASLSMSYVIVSNINQVLSGHHFHRHNRGVGNYTRSVKVNASLTWKVWQKDFHNVSSFSVTFIIVVFRGNTIRGTFVLQYCLV